MPRRAGDVVRTGRDSSGERNLAGAISGHRWASDEKRFEQRPETSQGNSIEDRLLDCVTEPGASQHQEKTLRLSQGPRGGGAIEDPNWNQIKHVEPGAHASQRRPERIASLIPDQTANSSGQASGQRSGQADSGARLQRDT